MKVVQPPNPFWIETELNADMTSYLWEQIDNSRVNAKNTLVGHHKRNPLRLPDPDHKLLDYMVEESKGLDYLYRPNLRRDDFWVNFQNKHEFNPFHMHHAIISFVIWMKIPYEYDNERKTEEAKGIGCECKSGCFEILYTDILGRILNYLYPLSSNSEGTVLIFPSQLSHQVYPFYTSDEERISISGNLL